MAFEAPSVDPRGQESCLAHSRLHYTLPTRCLSLLSRDPYSKCVLLITSSLPATRQCCALPLSLPGRQGQGVGLRKKRRENKVTQGEARGRNGKIRPQNLRERHRYPRMPYPATHLPHSTLPSPHAHTLTRTPRPTHLIQAITVQSSSRS